jgi:hypothetical protein
MCLSTKDVSLNRVQNANLYIYQSHGRYTTIHEYVVRQLRSADRLQSAGEIAAEEAALLRQD